MVVDVALDVAQPYGQVTEGLRKHDRFAREHGYNE